MGSYQISVKVEIKECFDEGVSDFRRMKDGGLEIKISEGDAISIDRCEKAVLGISYEAMRAAISNHLTEVSKKKP